MAYTRVQAGDDVTPEQINDVYDSMEKLEAISAEVVETLPAGSSATAQVVTDGSGNKKLELKIPQGATGAAGNDGVDGKSYRPQGLWNAATTYVNNSQYIDTVLGADGNQYYCKITNTNVATSNTSYWGILAQKGADGAGAGNLFGNNITAVVQTKTYGIKPALPLPSAGGTLAGELVEVAGTEDVNRKIEKDIETVYDEKTSLNDNDLIVIQDSESGATPKVNKRVKISRFKAIKVDNAGSADSATSAGSADNATNADITRTADANNGDKLQIGSGTSVNIVNAKIAKYASSDTSKGTIEQRLTNLGFKQASISVSSSNYIDAANCELSQQGNVVIGKLALKTPSMSYDTDGYITVATISGINNIFSQKVLLSINLQATGGAYVLWQVDLTFYLETDGRIRCYRNFTAGTNPGMGTVSSQNQPIVLAYNNNESLFYRGNA